jgi:hypothetical protein
VLATPHPMDLHRVGMFDHLQRHSLMTDLAAGLSRRLLPRAYIRFAIPSLEGGLLLLLLWNWLMPEIFGLKALTCWQAWGILSGRIA